MGRYIAINSRFEPFSLERYIQPLEKYKEAYDSAESKLDAYNTDASAIGAYLNEDRDGEYYTKYNNFMTNLYSASDELGNKGLRGVRDKLGKLKQEYRSTIDPLKAAIVAREKAIDTAEALSAKDDSARILNDPRSSSIGDYINGNRPTQKVISGNDIAKRAEAVAKAESARNFNFSRSNELGLKGQFHEILKEVGFSNTEADSIIQSYGTEEMHPLMTAIQDMLDNSGASEFGKGSADYKYFVSRALEGARVGLGYNKDIDLKEDKSFERALALKRQRLAELQFLASQSKPSNTGEVPINMGFLSREGASNNERRNNYRGVNIDQFLIYDPTSGKVKSTNPRISDKNIEKLEEAYSYLPGETMLDKIKTGIRLTNNQSSNDDYILTADIGVSPEQNRRFENLLTNIRASVKNSPEGTGQGDAKNAYGLEVYSNGSWKKVSKENAVTVLTDKVTLGATYNEPFVLIGEDGSIYRTVGNIPEINNLRNLRNNVDNFLKDYNKNGKGFINKDGNPTILTEEETLQIANNIEGLPITDDLAERVTDLGQGYYGAVSNYGNDIIKFIFAIARNSKGEPVFKVVGQSSLSDEASPWEPSGQRGEVIKSIISTYFNKYYGE